MADELDDEERELIRKHREARKDSDDSDEAEVTLPNGVTMRGSFRRVKDFAAAHGFRLIADPDAEEDKPKDKPKGAEVKRFSGRRVS